MDKKDKIFLFGASGHAKVVMDIIEQEGRYEIAFLVDDNPSLKGREFYGYPVIGGREQLLLSRADVSAGIVAIGGNRIRMTIASWLAENGFTLVTAIHPSARIGRGVTIGTGTVVMAGAVINSDSVIGVDTIVNTCASIDHDCTVGAGAHIAPGAILCGSVTIGEQAFICAGATIAPNITVGADVLVGAGATVIRDTPDNVTVVGTPARILDKK